MVFTYSVFGYVRYVLQVVYHVLVLTVDVLNSDKIWKIWKKDKLNGEMT
jgi:hypothetical protein